MHALHRIFPRLLILLASLALPLHAQTRGKTQQLTSPEQTPEGIAKSDWQRIRAAHKAWEHSFMATEGGWQARNPGQQWTAEFDGRSYLTKPQAAAWQWGLELRSYGFGTRQQMVHFRDAAGAPVVNYTGLKVWDADGVVLPSRFVAGPEGGIILRVEESGARYPITIDPIAQQAYLKPSALSAGTATAGDYFGWSVAVSGDTVVIGAEHENSSSTGVNSTPDELASDAGAVYVFVRSGTVWSQQAYLKASNAGGKKKEGRACAFMAPVSPTGPLR